MVRLAILAVGKPRLPFARAGAEEYMGRLCSNASAELVRLKSGPTAVAEGEALLARSAGMRRVVLDERGEAVGSREFARRLEGWLDDGTGPKTTAFLLGGADGHAPAVRAGAHWCWSLGPLTLPHELALVVAIEQLYRAFQIFAGSPYHREGPVAEARKHRRA